MQTILKQLDETAKQKFALIDELDLEPIMVKLMDKEEGAGWTLEQCLTAEKWYKRYLKLTLLYPCENIVPSKQIDTFWHFHILDTMKYQEDCEHIFGYFLHHFPYLGLRGAEDAENLSTLFEKTVALFKLEYGEDMAALNSVFLVGATCHGPNCGNSNGRGNQAGCDTGPGSCHVSCRGACHASPDGLREKTILANHIQKNNYNFMRPRLASVL